MSKINQSLKLWQLKRLNCEANNHHLVICSQGLDFFRQENFLQWPCGFQNQRVLSNPTFQKKQSWLQRRAGRLGRSGGMRLQLWIMIYLKCAKKCFWNSLEPQFCLGRVPKHYAERSRNWSKKKETKPLEIGFSTQNHVANSTKK